MAVVYLLASLFNLSERAWERVFFSLFFFDPHLCGNGRVTGQLGPLGHHIVPYISDTINDMSLKLKSCLIHKRTVFEKSHYIRSRLIRLPWTKNMKFSSGDHNSKTVCSQYFNRK